MTDPIVARVYKQIEAELGFGIVPNVFQAMAEMPLFLESMWGMFRGVVLQGRLPRVVKEMIGIVVSYTHGSAYARDIHLHSLTVQGLDKDVLGVLARGDTPTRGMAPAHAATLAFARIAALSPTAIPDASRESLVRAGLDSEEILEVIATIALFSAINAFTDTAKVKLDSV